MAKKVADPANPLTARTIVNRVWAWHFGAPLVNPGDFGPQTLAPKQQELLDWLAVWFVENDQSLKKLHRLLLTSEAFRLKPDATASNSNRDEGNTTFWRWNRQRLSFEAMRDRLLFTAGSLDMSTTGGRSVDEGCHGPRGAASSHGTSPSIRSSDRSARGSVGSRSARK